MTFESGGEFAPKRIESLPSVPLRDEQLRSLLAQQAVTEIWVPEDRPRDVSSGGGEIKHSGDIMNFWIEFDDRYVPIRWESPDTDSGLAWYRYDPTHKDEEMFVHHIRRMLTEDHRRLSEIVNVASRGES